MSVEKLVVRVTKQLKVHVEMHRFHRDAASVILVNGALATTASFGQTVKYMGERYNVICFDLPYAGQSRQHNREPFVLTKDDEIDILLDVARLLEPKFMYSVSWGGLAALLALARERTSIERAVIGSFSPHLNVAMLDYVGSARDFLAAGNHMAAAQLLNDTVGAHLPRIVKLMNYRYLTALGAEYHEQILFHTEQILALDPRDWLDKLAAIDCRVKFINGDLDQHTSARDIRQIAPYVRHAQFATVPGTGHFLELEGREQAAAVRGEILSFFGELESVAKPAPAFPATVAQTFASTMLASPLGA
ncbi:alpha/beta fold hydrolase [Paraburkholderia phosphatilytica]|uniref:alpha/beta fold hydrolase n=1 Tax=Paraburkholderia phosphatilytica TaxID=2282883 RepID=UPI001982669F|nr:alpha/beta hydrolase [Paraburkholderia phosphatilytica]